MLDDELMVSLAMMNFGDTVSEVKSTENLSFTLISWIESDIAVVGPYAYGDYYTFTAKPGMKFVIVFFEFKNNWVRPQSTPYIREGEIATDKGHIYPVWSPPSGIYSEEYNPRPSTDEEIITLLGSSAAYEELLPGESIRGCIVFEIPKDEKPVEAVIAKVPRIITFQANEGG